MSAARADWALLPALAAVPLKLATRFTAAALRSGKPIPVSCVVDIRDLVRR